MRRAVNLFKGRVNSGVGVLIAHENGDGATQGLPLENATQDLEFIGLFSGTHQIRLARTSPFQVGLNRCNIQQQAGRTTLHNAANSSAMTFTVRGESKTVLY